MEHLWSLCIEEQFYLLWPTIWSLCLLHRNDANGRRHATRVALAVLIAEPFVRDPLFPLPARLPQSRHVPHAGRRPHVRCARRSAARPRPLRAASTPASPAGPGCCRCLIFVVLNALTRALPELLGSSPRHDAQRLSSSSCGCCGWSRNPASLQGRILNQPVVAWVGRLSYSLYIWQTFFTHHLNVEVFGTRRLVDQLPRQLALRFSARPSSRTTSSSAQRCVSATSASAACTGMKSKGRKSGSNYG